MAISDYNPLNWNARRALEKTLRLFARAVSPGPAATPDIGPAVEQTTRSAWRAVQPQPGAPQPPGPSEIARRSAGPGQPPPSMPGAGYIDLAWRFLDPNPEQQKLWGAEDAKYARVSTAYGPTPQAYSSMSSVGLTIERLALVNQEASRDGYLTHKADLDFEIHQKWGHIKTAHRQRVAAVYRNRLLLRPRSKTELGRAVCNFVRGVIDDVPAFCKAEEDLLTAGRGGYSGQEIVWKRPRARRVAVGRKTYTVQDAKGIEALEWVHPRDFRWDPIRRRMLLDAGGTRYIDPFKNPDGSPTRKLILHGGDGEGDPHQRGYAYATDLLYMLSISSLSRWAVALEFFGVATPYMQYEGEGYVDDTDIADAQAFIAALGRGQPAILHRKFGKVEITPTPTGIDARGQHAAILGYLNGEASKCVAGQTLTMEIGGTGSYAASNTHADSKEDVQIIDAQLEADTQTHQTVRYIVEENAAQLARAFAGIPGFDGSIEQILAECPIAYRIVDRRMDAKDRLAVFQGAVTPRDKGGLGLDVDPEQIAEELNLRLRESIEEEEGDVEEQPPALAAAPQVPQLAAGEGKQPEQAKLELTSTDLATIVTVDQALASIGLPPRGDEDGKLTVAEFKAKHSGVVSAAAAASEGETGPGPAAPERTSSE